jgi:hypothetical protein
MRSGMRRKKEKMRPKKATQKMNTPAWSGLGLGLGLGL